MSSWMYISGYVKVSPFGRTQPEKRYILETVLDHLPMVTGSEGNLDVQIVQMPGHNSWSSHNEFGEFIHDSYDDRKRSAREKQDEYLLVIDAALRDRYFDTTLREFTKWLSRLAKRIWVSDILVRVEASIDGKTFLFKDASPYYDMLEKMSWDIRSGGEPAWVEYLLWDKAKGSCYPAKLFYKYYADPENDAEVERRIEYAKEARRG